MIDDVDRTLVLGLGGTVDYGKVHSEKYGHKRYGHTYDKPLVPDWGKLDAEGKIKKINLIGHSFGSPTTRTLVELLTNGSEEERKATKEGSLSPLFEGGHGDMIELLIKQHSNSAITAAEVEY